MFLRFGTGSDFAGVRSENVGKRTPADDGGCDWNKADQAPKALIVPADAKDGQADDHAHSFFS